jgi:low affinity Fe/Cu permease
MTSKIDRSEDEHRSYRFSMQSDKPCNSKTGICERVAGWAVCWTGSSSAFGLAVLTIVLWVILGPMFHYSDTWQLVINTSTTIVTFLMVFLIQRAQNKEALAVQLKLNEVIATLEGASNRLINVEDLPEKHISQLHQHFARLSLLAAKETSITKSHSIEEANERHEAKVALEN